MTDPYDVPAEVTFDEAFEELAPLLAQRSEGFRTIFRVVRESCLADRKLPMIVETGCLRQLGNWAGDGQSTFLFDLFVSKLGGTALSIEVSGESLAVARSVCRRATFICGDGAVELNRYTLLGARRIDLLYLDSFDHGRDVSVVPAPVHYAMELTAAWPALRPGSVVAIDDFRSPETSGGAIGTKGLAVELLMEKLGHEVIHDGYQKVWVIR